jgi:hypothetical protein
MFQKENLRSQGSGSRAIFGDKGQSGNTRLMDMEEDSI